MIKSSKGEYNSLRCFFQKYIKYKINAILDILKRKVRVLYFYEKAIFK